MLKQLNIFLRVPVKPAAGRSAFDRLFTPVSVDTRENLDELLELCSGRFTNQTTQQTFKSAFKKVKAEALEKPSIPDDNDDVTDNQDSIAESSKDEAYDSDSDLQDKYNVKETNDQEIDQSKRYNGYNLYVNTFNLMFYVELYMSTVALN